jgi:hypothetical protein
MTPSTTRSLPRPPLPNRVITRRPAAIIGRVPFDWNVTAAEVADAGGDGGLTLVASKQRRQAPARCGALSDAIYLRVIRLK